MPDTKNTNTPTIDWGKVPISGTVGQLGHTGAIASAFGNTDFGESKYDSDTLPSQYIKSGEYEKLRGERQDWGAETANAIGGGIAKIPFSVIGNVASILDFEDYVNSDKEVGNSITAWAEEVKGDIEKATKIYKSNDNTLGSREWWMNNGKGLIDSAGGFVLTGAGLGKGVQLLSELSKGSKVIQGIGTVTNAAMLNQAESVPIAMKVFQDAKSMGLSDQDAADAAAYSININRINIPLNLTSAFAFLRPVAATRQIAKDFSRKEVVGNILKEGSQEYLEENINMIAEKEALKKAALGNEYAYNFDNTVNDIFSREGFETGIVGFVGGIAQTAGTDLIGHLQKDAPSYDIDGNVRVDEQGQLIKVSRSQSQRERFVAQQKSLNNIEMLAKQEGVSTIKETLDKVKVTSELLNNIQIASINNDTDTVDKLKNQLLVNQSLDAFKNGTAEQLIDVYKSIQRDPQSKDKLGDDFHLKAQEAVKEIESLEKVYQKHQNLPQVDEVFQNRADYFYNLKEADKIKKELYQVQLEQSRELEVTGYTDPKKIETLVSTQELKGIIGKLEKVKANVLNLNEDFLKIISPEYTEEIVKQKEPVKTDEKTQKEPVGDSTTSTSDTSGDNVSTSSNTDLDIALAKIDEGEQKALDKASFEGKSEEALNKIRDKFEAKRQEAKVKHGKPVQTVDGFVERIKAGEKLESAEDLQFYENNKEEIEKKLKDDTTDVVDTDSDQVLDEDVKEFVPYNPKFDLQGKISNETYRTIAGRDEDKGANEIRYFRYLSNNTIPAGAKLRIVTRKNSPVLYNQILSTDPTASEFEKNNPKHDSTKNGIVTVLVDKDGSPILADQTGKVVDKGDANNYIVSRIPKNDTTKKHRAEILAQIESVYVAVTGISKGIDVREKTETGERAFNPALGHLTTSINPNTPEGSGLLEIAKISATGDKNVVLKNGQVGKAGRLYGFLKGDAFDMIPRRLTPNESILVTELLAQRIGIVEKTVESPSAELDKLIYFGVPKDGPKNTTLGIREGKLYIGTQVFTFEEFKTSQEAHEALNKVLEAKYVNINAKIALTDEYQEPILNQNTGTIEYKTWNSYQEYLLSNEGGRLPLFGIDLPALGEPRFRNYYMMYNPSITTSDIKVTSTEVKPEVINPVSTDIKDNTKDYTSDLDTKDKKSTFTDSKTKEDKIKEVFKRKPGSRKINLNDKTITGDDVAERKKDCE